jgi:putative transposase
MREIYNAEDIDKAQVAVKALELDYGAKYPKAVAKITNDLDGLLEFYRYPAEHWVHLRTTNPIVIWSPPVGVLDVRHEALRSQVLRGGRAYLQLSRRQEPVEGRCRLHELSRRCRCVSRGLFSVTTMLR